MTSRCIGAVSFQPQRAHAVLHPIGATVLLVACGLSHAARCHGRQAVASRRCADLRVWLCQPDSASLPTPGILAGVVCTGRTEP